MAKKGMIKFHYLFHSIAYYVAWFLCLKLAAHDYAWLSTFIVIACVLLQIYWQYKIQRKTQGLWQLLGLIIFISTLTDSLLIFNGVIIYAANPFAPYITAPWMIAIWISFTVVLYATLHRLFNHLMLLGILSFAGFALAYGMGAKMGAAFFPYGYKTCLLIGAIWLILLPFIGYCYKKIMEIK
jgi:hypothetical protein